jgi:hydroxymethylpyrimidine/phosphomethylpyrimidine kinase
MTSNLADRYFEVKQQIEALERVLDGIKADIKAEGREAIEGVKAIVTLTLSERSSLDTKMVKALLTDEQINACTRTTLVETIRVKAITEALV